MHILISGSSVERSLEWEYARALRSAGCEISFHSSNEPVRDRLTNLGFAALRCASPRFGFDDINKSLLFLASSHRPDIILIFKGAYAYPDTIRTLISRGFRTIVYNPDHPFDFSSRGTGNRLIAQAAPEYGAFLTYSRHIASQVKERYPHLPVRVVPFGHGVDGETFYKISEEPEIVRLCFVGNFDVYRAKRIAVLVRSGLEVDIFGHGWGGSVAVRGGASYLGPAIGEDMYRILRRYRVQLNFLRAHNVHSHNMRTFEIPASGGIMLAEDTVEHREFFEPCYEASYFSSDEDLISQARILMGLTPPEARRMRERARARALGSGYLYYDRAQCLVRHILSLPVL